MNTTITAQVIAQVDYFKSHGARLSADDMDSLDKALFSLRDIIENRDESDPVTEELTKAYDGLMIIIMSQPGSIAAEWRFSPTGNCPDCERIQRLPDHHLWADE